MSTYRVPVLEDFSWQPPIKDKDLETAPAEPSKGDRYIVAANGGDWSGGAAKDITYYDGENWQFDTPSEGWKCWVEDEDLYYHFDGTNWVTAELDAVSDMQETLSNLMTSTLSHISALVSNATSLEAVLSDETTAVSDALTSAISHLDAARSDHTSLEAVLSDETTAVSDEVLAVSNLQATMSNLLTSAISHISAERSNVASVETVLSDATLAVSDALTSNISHLTAARSDHTSLEAVKQDLGTYVAEYGAIQFTV